MQLPKRIEQHVIETKSYKIYESIIPNEWIIREITERDYGIDSYIEICENGYITGKMVFIQLKGANNIEITKKEKFATYYNIGISTFNYWNNLPVPIILLYIDINKKDIYFSNIKEYIRENYSDYINESLNHLKIPHKHKIASCNAAEVISEIYAKESTRQEFELLITNFIISLSSNIEKIEAHVCRDCFFGMDFDEDDGEDLILLSNFYKQCKYFASFFNIPWTVNSYEKIIDDGRRKYGEYYDFYEGEIAIAIQQGIPILLKIVDKIKKIIQDEESFWEIRNPLLLNYIENFYDENIKSIKNCIYF